MIPRSVFCEALHSEASRRKRETNRQDLAFFKRRFIDFGGKKKGEQEAGALHPFRCFARATASYGGKRKHILAFMENWPTMATCKT